MDIHSIIALSGGNPLKALDAIRENIPPGEEQAKAIAVALSLLEKFNI